MRVDLFDFDLPQELIAQRPAVAARCRRACSTSRRMACTTARCATCRACCSPATCWSSTTRKVIPARLLGTRASGGKVEALLIRQQAADRWLAFARPGKRLQARRCPRPSARSSAQVAAKHDDGSIDIAFDRGGAELMAAIESGRRRAAAALYPRRHRRRARPRRLPDAVRQGRRLGRRADRRPAFHAGADGGARRRRRPHAPTSPCMSAPAPSSRCGSRTPTEHVMHAEWGEVPQATADAIAGAPRRVVSIGTTALRLLEIGGARRADARLDRRDRHLHHAGLSGSASSTCC